MFKKGDIVRMKKVARNTEDGVYFSGRGIFRGQDEDGIHYGIELLDDLKHKPFGSADNGNWSLSEYDLRLLELFVKEKKVKEKSKEYKVKLDWDNIQSKPKK